MAIELKDNSIGKCSLESNKEKVEEKMSIGTNTAEEQKQYVSSESPNLQSEYGIASNVEEKRKSNDTNGKVSKETESMKNANIAEDKSDTCNKSVKVSQNEEIIDAKSC